MPRFGNGRYGSSLFDDVKVSVKSRIDDSQSVSTRRSLQSTAYSGWSKRLPFGKPRTPLRQLAKLQKYGEIIDILESNNYDIKSWLRDCADLRSGQTVLHLVLDHRPPFKVVDLLLMRMQQIDTSSIPETVQDKQGKTPMHVAVARACDVRIIERFLGRKDKSPMVNPAAVADRDMKYPLHYACENPSRLRKAMISKLATDSSIENMVRIISCLVVACPTAADSKDLIGWTPKDMATTQRADKRILRLLEYAGELQLTQKQDLQLKQKQDLQLKQKQDLQLKQKQDSNQQKLSCASNTSTQASTETSSIECVPVEIISSDFLEDDNDMSSLFCWEEDFKSTMPKATQVKKGGGDVEKHEMQQSAAVPQIYLFRNSPEVIKKCWFL